MDWINRGAYYDNLMAQVQAQAQAQASDAYRLQVGHNYVNDTHFYLTKNTI